MLNFTAENTSKRNMNDILIENTLDRLDSEELAQHFSHVVCNGGQCDFCFNEKPFTLHSGDSMVIVANRLVSDIRPSADFQVRVVYVSPRFLEATRPTNNYQVRGAVALHHNPVMPLLWDEHQLLNTDIDQLELRLRQPDKHFLRDTITCLLQVMYIDFFEFHRRISAAEESIPERAGEIMTQFLALLDTGIYRTERTVAYYADRLCVSPKYLSEVTNLVSGHSAIYWIHRFATLEISRLLREKNLTPTEISDRFGFSSLSYFTRFVRRTMGMTPSDLRLQ